MSDLAPAAQLTYSVGGTLKYELPTDQVCVFVLCGGAIALVGWVLCMMGGVGPHKLMCASGWSLTEYLCALRLHCLLLAGVMRDVHTHCRSA